jgi:hypothetical protein
MCELLLGSTALVTGATAGIGRVVGMQLAQLGAHVVVHSHDAGRGAEVVPEIKLGGGRARLVVADLAEPDAVRQPASSAGRHTDQQCGCLSVRATVETDDKTLICTSTLTSSLRSFRSENCPPDGGARSGRHREHQHIPRLGGRSRRWHLRRFKGWPRAVDIGVGRRVRAVQRPG